MANRTDEWAYRIPFAVQWIWPIPLIVLIYFAPESPWFLVRAGRLEEAAASVARIQKKGSTVDPRDTVAMMVRTNEHEKAISAGVRYIDCFRGSDLRRTEIACFAWAAQCLSGLGFSGQFVYFLQQAGVSASDSFSFNLGSVAMGFVGTILSWFVMNRYGRRTIMVWGSFGLTAL
jgi:SP family general alpha glucoside:H+ symporter-like MFS transporter